jgi:hypothetical protein
VMHLTCCPRTSRARARPAAGSPKEGTGSVSLLILSPTHSNPKKTLTPRRNHTARERERSGTLSDPGAHSAVHFIKEASADRVPHRGLPGTCGGHRQRQLLEVCSFMPPVLALIDLGQDQQPEAYSGCPCETISLRVMVVGSMMTGVPKCGVGRFLHDRG